MPNNHNERAHEINGPSSLSRRIACPGSREAEEGMPDTTSPAAEEGTRAHELLERLLLGQNPLGNEPVEMLQACMEAFKWVETFTSKGYELHVEKKVDPSWALGDHTKGTTDIILINHKDKKVIVADFKYGQGYGVDAIGNPQLISYAAGVQAAYLGQDSGYEFSLVIIQPRIRTGATVKSCTMTYADIYSEWFRLKEALILTWEDGAIRVPSKDACHFCKAKLSCPERVEELQVDIAAAFTAAQIPIATVALEPTGASIQGLSEMMLTSILDLEPIFNALLDDIRGECRTRIRAGKNVAGYKIVKGSANRRWILSEEELRHKFKSMKISMDDYENVKIKSPAQLEAVEFVRNLSDKKRANLANFWEKPAGPDKLVISTAPGTAIVFDSSEAFAAAAAAAIVQQEPTEEPPPLSFL